MNPLIVIVGFVVILAGLLYYLQGRQGEPDTLPVASSEEKERKIVKVSDYQAEYEKEEKTKEPETEEREVQEAPESTQEEAPEEEDISMLDGVGPKYQELLRAAGYNTISSIAEATPETLYSKIIEINNETEITKRPPTMSNIEDWVTAAKSRQA